MIHGAESTFASTHEVGYRLAPMHPTSMRPWQKRQTEHAYYSIVGTKRLERVAALFEALATTDTLIPTNPIQSIVNNYRC